MGSVLSLMVRREFDDALTWEFDEDALSPILVASAASKAVLAYHAGASLCVEHEPNNAWEQVFGRQVDQV